MKKIKKMTIAVMFSCLVFLTFSVGTYAEEITTTYYKYNDSSVNKDFDVPDEQLYKARDMFSSPATCKNDVICDAKIENSYDIHIYRFYVPQEGDYTAYTRGPSDTMIRIYREKQQLWWINGFTSDYAAFDDGSMVDSNSFNAYSRVYLTKGYYYAAVKMYGSKTGEYKMVIAPNEDLILREKFDYNHWTVDSDDKMNGNGVNFIHYFTAEETLLMLWLTGNNMLFNSMYEKFCEENNIEYVPNNDILNGLRSQNPDAKMKAKSALTTAMSALANLAGLSTPASISLTGIISILVYFTPAEQTYFNKIVEKCQIICDSCIIINGKTYYSYRPGKGLIVVGLGGIEGGVYEYGIQAYDFNSEYFKGKPYAKGTWSKE